MDLNRMKKLAGLLRENVEGEEQEVNEAANQKTVDFLVQKVSEDSRFKKMDVLMSKLGGGAWPFLVGGAICLGGSIVTGKQIGRAHV